MTWRLTPAVAVAVASAVAVAVSTRVAGQGAQNQQTFRARTDVVFVDVSVREGGQPVTGLEAGDFRLTDNGVVQTVESVEATAVPIDLTLVADASGNPRRPRGSRVPASETARRLRSEVERITALLRPDDRVRLFVIDQDVQLVWPLAPVSSQPPIVLSGSDGLASLYDTLTAALLQPVEPARRHIVIAETKGVDTMSAVGAAAVEAVARRADALLHVVIDETALDNEAADAAFQCAFIGYCWPTRRSWLPVYRRLVGPRPVHPLLADGRTVAAAAESTGGAVHQTTVARVPSLANTFRRVFDDFRSGYMLRYTPEGVAREGWHVIEVTVPRSRSYTVRARNGYGVEEPPPAPEPVTPPAIPETLPDFVAAYDRADYGAFATGLRQVRDPGRLIRDFEEGGNPWPASPRREAAFALELADLGGASPNRTTQEAAYALLGRFAALVRHPLAPDSFELYWHFAAVTLAEGWMQPGQAEAVVNRALGRFPAEPRFVLSSAIVADQLGTPMARGGPTVDNRGRPTPEHSETVISRYKAAAAVPAVAAEARVRLAWFLHRLDRDEEALEFLTTAGAEPIQEDAVRYLRAIFLGHVLVALDRHDEAAVAYREALAAVPSAQSARVSLMNVLVIRGDRAGAEGLAEDVEIESTDAVDPWWIYWQGQHRFAAFAIGRIREMAR